MKTKTRTRTVKTVHRRYAHIVKNPPSYISPYKVVIGPNQAFHSWHSTRRSAVAEAARLNKIYSGYIETWRK